jgi:coproporphyrinogen III oxidase-like Fe-S oxidoreductase
MNTAIRRRRLTARNPTDIRPGRESEAAHQVPADVVLDRVRSAISRNSRQRSLLIYIHVPFCSSKCNFCAWVAGISTPQLRSSDDVRWHYAIALKEQIAFYAPRLTDLGYVPEIVYWGGGTPSALSADQIRIIGDALRDNFDLSTVNEYSVESSPETLAAEKITEFQAAGMDRLSVGVQSFDESELRRAGRAHSAAEAASAVRRAKHQGCANRNVDIITGFPKQTPEVLKETLMKTIALRPEHVTSYSYYLADETVMTRQVARGHLPALSTDQRASAQDLAYQVLTANGYNEYMPMYYSLRPQHRFGGEIYYFDWEGDHIGFGSGANSVLATHKLLNMRGNLEQYISSPTTCDLFERPGVSTALDESIRLMYVMGRQLRYDRFFDRFGFDFSVLLGTPRMKAFQLALDRVKAPLLLTSNEAYISAPAGGWHGGRLLRLAGRVRAVMAGRKSQVGLGDVI